MTPAGLEPAIPGSIGRCLIHWATGPSVNLANLSGDFSHLINTHIAHLFHASGLAAELFFCVPRLVLPRGLCLEALGQSAPSAPTKPGQAVLRRHPQRNTRNGCMLLFLARPFCWLLWSNTAMTPAGLEPAIPGSVGRCLIHWATGPSD